MKADIQPQAKQYTATDRPKRSMKETWYREKQWSQWNFAQRLLFLVRLMPPKNAPKPPYKEATEPVGVFTELAQWAFWFPLAATTPTLQYIYMKTTGETWSPFAAYCTYLFSFIVFSILTVQQLNRLGLKHGYFDSKHSRDGVPDQQSHTVLWSLTATVAFRPIVGFYFSYDRNELPWISPWFPLQAFAYATTLDLFFYCYHRVMHEVPFLWKFHQRHHETHHPNALLSPFADLEQDVFDIVVVPYLTFATLPMNFHTFWMISLGILYTEAAGHSGVRLYLPAPLTGYILRPLGMELALEDHDIHHRHGWKDRGGNYGKQTRVWDFMFGTMRPRIETQWKQVDWNNKVPMFG